MTLTVAFKGPEGLVLAVDSRVTLNATKAASADQPAQSTISYFDNGTKMLTIDGYPHVGILVHDALMIGTTERNIRGIHGFIPEFEATLASQRPPTKPAGGGTRREGRRRLTVEQLARKLGEFYGEQWRLAGMSPEAMGINFLVAGFDDDEPYGKIYELAVPAAPEPVEQYAGHVFGIRWGGQSNLVTRLVNGIDPRAADIAKDELKLTDEKVTALKERWLRDLNLPIGYALLPLQDCVDAATMLVSMTVAVQRWNTTGEQGVGGPVDVATITRADGFKPLRQKQVEAREWTLSQ
jgi:hypothetical protein